MQRWIVAALLVLAAGLAPVASAQTPTPPAGAYNWAYMSDLGRTGGFTLADQDDSQQKLQLLRINPGFWLRNPDRHSWGLKLLIPVTFGVNETTFLQGAVEDSIRAFSVTPSVEAFFPSWKIVTWRPRIGAGYGRNSDTGDDAFVFESGLKVDVNPLWKTLDILVRPELRYDFARTRSGLGDDDLGVISIKLDLLHALPLKLGQYVPDMSVYGEYGHYFETALLDIPGADPLEVSNQTEVGFSLGSEPRVKLWFIRLSRVSVGWRWGDGLSGIRIRIGAR